MLNIKNKMYEETNRVTELFISYESASKLKHALKSSRYDSDSLLLEAKSWIGSLVRSCLSSEQVYVLESFKHCNQQNALMIRGLPSESDLCGTPYNGYIDSSQTALVNCIHIGIYQIIGIEPISYENENQGLLFRNVVSSQSAVSERSSHGSIHTFGHHVDNPDLPLACEPISTRSGCPEFLSLMALRSDLSVRSNFIAVDDLISQLSAGVVCELLKPNFKINRPDSFGQSKAAYLPIFVQDNNGVLFCRYDKENSTPLTEPAAAALVMLEAQIQNESIKHYLVYQPGDLLIIKNQRVVHSREGFQARDDGADRWLVRLFGMSSLDRIVQANKHIKHIAKD